MKLALRTNVLTATRLLSVAALWARLRRVGFIDSSGSDTSELGLVLDHPSKLAGGPLVQPLIHLAAVVNPITDAANIADSNRRDTSLKEHLHDLSAQFVKKVRDLVIDVLELLVFRFDQLLPAIRATLFAVYLRIELCLQLVLVMAKGAKFTAVDRERIVASEHGGKMFFAEINPSNLISGRAINRFYIVLSADNKPTGTLPDLDRTRFLVHGPIDQNRVVSALRGQAEDTVIPERDALIGPPKNVVLFVAASGRITSPVVVMPGADRFVELLCDFLGCLRRKNVVAFAVPLSHRRLTEPVVLPVDSSPVPLADVVPQLSRGAGQPLKLLRGLDMEFASEVHLLRLIFDILLYDRLAHLSGRRDEVAPRPERRKPMQMIKFLSQNVGARSFEPVNYLVRSMACISLDE